LNTHCKGRVFGAKPLRFDLGASQRRRSPTITNKTFGSERKTSGIAAQLADALALNESTAVSTTV
jgi:hypothetical protein